ncbi:hypothetical protein ACFL1R_11235 [Candidatus Latescibacterota bacterium]
MPKVSLQSAVEGDILAKPVVIGDVELFEAGTVLVKKSIEILGTLGVNSLYLERRTRKKTTSTKELLINVDARFSYVENNPFMMSLKSRIKDILINIGNMEQ